ncbi:hypothetical protein [Pseudomonas sp.]|uniref:hypothetical protein n=1 Tax=Pseudomonas sp. TaxID=306 RepID=UPI003D6F323F
MDVTNWSHPFKDQSHPLSQLTQLGNATAGYYPLGRNALWHGGVHFDSGTAGFLDQSAVYCVADGEVVAYRIDEHSPTTSYVDNDQCVAKPFSRNFVLVRHRLQPPCIEGCAQTPPSLTLYSVYMHLQDWAFYREDPTVARPAFWPEKATDGVVVLQAPVAIRAADLIGHIGLYQCGDAKKPERKLHLEVFSADDVEGFLDASRAWAQQLPASDKTWLKLAAGTAVVPHQEGFGVTQCPVPNDASPVSGADLLLPKALLDSLPPESKMTHVQGTASTWYRLEGLLLDADNHPLDGWVCETVGVTPWVSPWSWEGYTIVYSVDTSLSALAALLRDLGRLSEAQLARFGRVADEGNKGRIKSRLYDIIDRNRDGKITAAELQAAIRQPSHAQSISRLIIHTESEWSQPGKWDGLDEMLGHTRLTPNLNWLAEKQRINALCWWEEVAPKIGLPGNGAVYHFHPVGLVGQFSVLSNVNYLVVRRGQITFDAEGNDIAISPYFSRCLHWPGGASGVTLGRGYDMRHRTRNTVYKDLISAGVDATSAEKFSLGAGLFGQAASGFVRENKHSFGTISAKAQRILFEDLIYPFYEAVSKQQYNTVVEVNGVAWGQLDARVRDIVVDLTYQQGSVWKRQWPYVLKGNRLELAHYIENTPELMRYEAGRKRVSYLRAN